MIGTTNARAQTLRRHIATDDARGRVARAIFESIVDGLELGPDRLPSTDDRAWLRGELAGWLDETAAVALDLAAWRTARALAQAPNRLGDRYDDSHRAEERRLA